MTRKITLSRSEVEMAKSMGIPLETVAKAKLPKRGRPVGSKNKPKRGRPIASKAKPKLTKPEQKAVDSFAETLAEWDRKEQEVDFKDLCQKLQEALAKSYCDYEELEIKVNFLTGEANKVDELRNEIAARDVIIRYLEGRSL